MIFSGFSDEAGRELDSQIEATRQLGWHHIEVRNIGGKGFADLDDGEFAEFCSKLEAADISVNCVGSAIANWSRDPRSDEDFAKDMHDLDVLLPRMRTLGITMLRGMSYKIDPTGGFDAPELEKIIFGKVRRLVERCAEYGVVYVHENCMNYGGQSFEHTLRLLDAIPLENLKLVFDTGNPLFTFRRIGSYRPYPLQSAWEFYRNVRDFVVHVHIKDGVPWELPTDDIQRPSMHFTWAGDGAGQVRPILLDLKDRGYDGAISIEPHVATVFHETDNQDDTATAAKRKFETYVEYGRRFMKLAKDCGFRACP